MSTVEIYATFDDGSDLTNVTSDQVEFIVLSKDTAGAGCDSYTDEFDCVMIKNTGTGPRAVEGVVAFQPSEVALEGIKSGMKIFPGGSILKGANKKFLLAGQVGSCTGKAIFSANVVSG